VAAVSCPDRVPAAINTVPSAALDCQNRIALEGVKFLRKKMNVLTACKLKRAPGACPTANDQQVLQRAAVKAAEKINQFCGTDAAQDALPSSYGTLTDDAVISSCMLSQHNVLAEYVVANAVGASTEDWPGIGDEREICLKEIAKRGRLFAANSLNNARVCLKKKMNDGVVGNLAPICIGQFSGGVWVPPTDTSTANKQAALMALVEQKVTDKCGALSTSDRATIFGCSQTTDYSACLICEGWDSTLDALEQQFVESGTYVAHAAGALQTAVSAASPGAKLLIGSGDYVEEVTATADDLKIVGCGGATNDRPRIVAPMTQITGRGIQANGVDGLVFQSLEVFGQQNDGLRVSLCNGVTFRDIVGDGNLVSNYSVFPQTCNDVVVELCKVTRVDDAPLYVGQSSTIIVRHNEVRDSVAGIEIENCGNAQVYGNYATGNTGGILAFKDGSLPVQLSECHDIHHNVLESNNTPNFGSGTVAKVPAGSGILCVSTDATLVHHNVSRDNDTFGIVLTDQYIAEFGPPFSEADPTDNYIWENNAQPNGANPDFLFGADMVAIMFNASVGNCKGTGTETNWYATENGFNALPNCTLPPPAFSQCPAPPVP
jgi:parallel beta-helix repeat protein